MAIEKRKGDPVVYIEAARGRADVREFAKAWLKCRDLTGCNSNPAKALSDAELLAV